MGLKIPGIDLLSNRKKKKEETTTQGSSKSGMAIVLRNNPTADANVQNELKKYGYSDAAIQRLADKDNREAFESDMQTYKNASRTETKATKQKYNHNGTTVKQHKAKVQAEKDADLLNTKKAIASKYGITEDEFDTAYDTYKDSKQSKNKSIDTWLSPDYKMSKEDRAESKKITSDYFKNNKKAKALYNARNANETAAIMASMTPEDKEEYARMTSLENKTSALTSAYTGFMSAVPTYNRNYDKISKTVNENMGLKGDYSYSTAVENSGKQNKAAQIGGRLAGTAAMYGVANKVIPNAPILGKMTSATGKALASVPGLGKLGQTALTGFSNDMAADVLLDTLPEYYENRKNGMSSKDARKEAYKNLGVNAAFNLLPTVADSIMNKNTVVDSLIKENPHYNSKVAELIKNNPVDEADDVVENVVKQSIPEVTTGNVDISDLGKATKTKTPKMNPNYDISYDVPTLNNDIKWGRNKEATLRRLLSDNTLSVEQKENILRQYTENNPATQEQIREILANPNYSKETKDAVLKAANEKKPIPQIITGDLNVDKKLANIPGRVDVNTKVPEHLGVYDSLTKNTPNVVDTEKKISDLQTELSQSGKKAVVNAEPTQIDNVVKQEPINNTVQGVANNTPINNVIPGTTKEKVSEFYDSTAKKALTPEEYEKLDPKDFTYNSMDEKTSVDTAKKNIAKYGIENRATDLLNKNFESSVDTDEAMIIYRQYADQAEALRNSGDTLGAEKLDYQALKMIKKVGQQGSKSAQVLQSLKKWGRNTPEGSLAYAIAKVEQKANKNVGKGKLKQIAKVEEKVVAIFNNNALSKEDKIKEISKIYEQNKLVQGEKELKKLLKEGKKVDSFDLASELKKANKIVEMTPEQQLNYLEEAKKVLSLEPGSVEYKKQMARLGKSISEMIPDSYGNFFKSFLYDNMLGSIRTIVSRNMGGNLGMQLMERTATKQVAAGIDKALSKLTGNEHRLRGVSLQSTKDYASGFKKGWGESWEEVFNVWKKGAEDLRTTKTGYDDISDYYEANKHLTLNTDNEFLKKAAKAFDKWDSTIKTVMNAGDKPFYEARYAECVGEWNRMRKSGEAFRSLSDDEFKEYCDIFAKLEANSAVYQNNSEMATAFQQMKNAIGKYSEAATGVDVASQFVMPMVQVPGNIADRIIQYSPFGFLKTGIKSGANYLSNGSGNLLEKVKNGNIDQDFQGELATMLARNIIGTGVSGAGWGLKKLGDYTTENWGKDKAIGMTGGYDDDTNVAAAQRENGEQEYALRYGGRDHDISWLTGLGTALQAGATAADAYDKSKDMGKALLKGIGGAFDNSMTQGLNRLVGGENNYSNNTDSNFVTNTFDTIRAGGSQFIPAWLRQTANATDKYKRDLGQYGSDEYYRNSLISGIPVLRELMLDKKVGTNGEYILQNEGMNPLRKAVENYFLPGLTSNLSDNEAYDEAMRIYRETGNKNAFLPGYSRTKISSDYLGLDENEKLTTEQYEDAREKLGKANSEVFDVFSKSDLYNSLDDEGKADLLNSAYAIVQNDFKSKYKKGGYEPSQNKNEFEAYQEGGAKGLLNYISDKEKAQSAGYSNIEDYNEEFEKNGQEGIDAHIKEKQELEALDKKLDIETQIRNIKKETGVKIDKSTYADLYKKGGQKAVDRYVEDTKYVNDINKQYGLTDNKMTVKEMRKARQTNSVNILAQSKKSVANFNKNYGKDLSVDTYTSYKDKGASDKEINTVLDVKDKASGTKTKDVLDVLNHYNYSDSEKNTVLKYTLSKDTLTSKYIQRGMTTFGESSLFTLINTKNMYDSNGDGNLNKTELNTLLANVPASEKNAWRYVFKGK